MVLSDDVRIERLRKIREKGHPIAKTKLFYKGVTQPSDIFPGCCQVYRAES